jgi:two-component system phosphate regulon sensor histidine kinase PhoR
VVGILLVATGGSRSVAIVAGILVLVFCGTALGGYVLGTIFVTRGASLADLQNEFLSAVSHEIRTPLTSIRMFIETLREERVTDPGEKQRCLTIVHDELLRLDRLVGRLIDLSKLESGRDAFDRHPIALDHVLADALAAVQAMHVGNELTVRMDPAPGLVVVGDRAALSRAVANLISNAWKYTPPEDRQVSVTARADGKHVIVSISDNGAGIPLDEQRAIFEPFHRGRRAIDGRTAGHGLGLAIVRAIVRAHKGDVQLESSPGRGSTFRISLPRFREATRAGT